MDFSKKNEDMPPILLHIVIPSGWLSYDANALDFIPPPHQVRQVGHHNQTNQHDHQKGAGTIGSMLTFASIVFGAALTMKVQYYLLEGKHFFSAVRLGLADLRLAPKPKAA